MGMNRERSYGEDVALSDRTGKVFVVLSRDKRKCMICEQVFARNESAEHANVICYPAACEARP
jgi:hypothetical protein